MAKFIQLTRKNGKEIYVNVDAISFIGDGNDCYPLEVEETPKQILEKLKED